MLPFAVANAYAVAAPSEISVKLVPERREYIVGERIRAVVDIANSSADSIDVGKPGSADFFRIEAYRASDMASRPRVGNRPFVAPFLLHSSEGQKLPRRYKLYDRIKDNVSLRTIDIVIISTSALIIIALIYGILTATPPQ